MTDVTLSKAVRSNLLHLQNTAKMMDRTQERLATGLKVNSALDNPTNFFTASALNARAKDLDLLMDAISNGVQTLQAADKGISSITKLVEAAQATARQALQTTPMVQQPVRQAGTVNTVNLSALAIAGPQPAQPASTGTVDLTTFVATDGQLEAIAEQTFDLTGVTVGAGNGGTFTVNGETVTIGDGNGPNEIYAALQAAESANAVANGGTATFSVSRAGDQITITAAVGEDLVIANGTGDVANYNLATGTTPYTPEVEQTTGTFTINGHTVTIADGDALTDVITAFENAAAASGGATAFTVSDAGGVITITGVGPNSLSFAGDATALGAVGLPTTPVQAQPETPTQVGVITINGVDVPIAEGDDQSAIVAKLQAAAATSTGTDQFTVTVNGGFVSIEGVGTNAVSIGGAAAPLAALGLTAGNHQGAPTGATIEVPNPKRTEMVTQYNELLQQISDMTKDANFNGVNLINGDNLEVLFNEDGTSRLEIQGVTFDALNLNLLTLDADGFDANPDIESVLATLKEAMGTLRTQASRFGANLTVVEARQNFTKEMINTLESGAANLTLADTNEEAANMLALQTRQQLSQTALSLASQADQAVLRLFG